MQEPRIVTISELKLVGKRIQTTLAENSTGKLWQSFGPYKKEILHPANTNLYSVQIFAEDQDFEKFTPQTRFEKWAAIEVDRFDKLPDGMEILTLKGGKYAVFIHKGLPSDFPKTSHYIHREWMPNSLYELDSRPHFEIMQEGYSPTDPEAEEEVWIPIKQNEIGYEL